MSVRLKSNDLLVLWIIYSFPEVATWEDLRMKFEEIIDCYQLPLYKLWLPAQQRSIKRLKKAGLLTPKRKLTEEGKMLVEQLIANGHYGNPETARNGIISFEPGILAEVNYE